MKGNDGWSRYARDLVLSAQKRPGVEVLCLVNEIDPHTKAQQRLLLDKGPLAYIVNPLLCFLNARKLNKVIKEFKPDIMQFVVEPYGMMVPFLKKGQTKIVLNAHSTYAFLPILVSSKIRKKISQMMTLWSYKKIDAVICISKYTGQHVRKHVASIGGTQYIENKLYVIGGGIQEDSIDKVARAPLSNNPKEILGVGAVKARKGMAESIDALAHVKTNFIYRIVGSLDSNGAYVQLLRKKIQEYNLTDKVILVGQISDDELQRMYKKADLFLMLSTNNGADFEGYGLVYLEANGRGVPTIGPGDSGVSDAISDGKSGYIVDQYKSKEVAKKIDMVLGGSIRAEDCIAWARENRSEMHTQKMFDMYKQILK